MRERAQAFLFHRGDLTRREIMTVGLLAVVIAMVFNAPMLPRMADSMPEIGFGDPYLTAWMVAWDGQALTEQPTDIWNSNTFWPWDDSLAFSDALLGYAPAGLLGEGIRAAVVRHNLLYLFAHAFAFLGAYLLARELGVSPLAALVAAAVFAYAPWRLDQRTHLHVISSGGIPVTMLLFARGYMRRKPWLIIAAALVAIWQISLGFTLGVPLGYSLGALGVIGLLIHLRYGTKPLGRRVLVASGCAALIMGAWVAWQAMPYYRVVDEHPEARRTVRQVSFFSPPLSGLITAPKSNFVWGNVTQTARGSLNWPSEQALFPGIGAIALATLGLSSGRAKRVRVLLLIGTVLCLYLSMGLKAPGGSIIYRVLYDWMPGWEGIRVPGRLMTLTSLGLGCLAAYGCQYLIDRNAGLKKADRGRALVIALIPVVILLEGAGTVEVTDAPLPPASLAAIEGPRIHLPTDGLNDRVYMFWSIDGFYPIANGESGFAPSSIVRLRTMMLTFPDAASVTLVRELGVGTVVFHPDMVGYEISTLPPLTGEGNAEERLERLRAEHFRKMITADISGLGITREVREDLVIFRLAGADVEP